MPTTDPSDDIGYHDARVSWVLVALIVGSMLAFDPAGWAVFGPIKWALVTTLTLAALALLLRRGSITMHRSSAIGWALFLAWGIVVGITAADPIHTWIGTPDRHLGLLAWLLFAILFVVGQSVGAQASIRLILKAATIALLGIGLYTLLEWIDSAPVELSLTTGRFGGPFGSPAYLGAACALLLPIVVGSVVDGLGSRWWRITAVVAIGLGAAAVIGSQTRAAWVGLAVGGLVAVPALLPWLRRTRWVPVVVAVLGFAILIATPAGDRARAVFDSDDPSTRGRLDEWRIASAVVAARPVLGAGFEGHRIVFPEEVDAEYERSYGRRVMPDRAHNGALDIAVTTGIPGLLIYVAGLVFLLRRAWRGVRSARPWLVGVAAGVVGYVAQQQFLFPLAEVDPILWVFAGVVVANTGQAERQISFKPPRQMGAAVAALALVALIAGVLDVAADRLTRSAFDESAAGNHATALERADRATTLRPDSMRYPLVAGAVAAETGSASSLDAAIERVSTSLGISPDDPILLERRAEYLLDKARLTGDATDISAAVTAWSGRASADPNNARVQLQYGVSAAVARDAATAELAWLRAEELAPRSAAPAANLAALYLAGGQIDAARAAAERGLSIEPDYSTLVALLGQIEATAEPSP